MKLSAIIAFALSLLAIARPLEIPGQSESDLIRRMPTNPSEEGITASPPRLNRRGNTIARLSSKGKSSQDNPSGSQKYKEDLDYLHSQIVHAKNAYEEKLRILNKNRDDGTARAELVVLGKRLSYTTSERANYLDTLQIARGTAQSNYETKLKAAGNPPYDTAVKTDLALAEQQHKDSQDAYHKANEYDLILKASWAGQQSS